MALILNIYDRHIRYRIKSGKNIDRIVRVIRWHHDNIYTAKFVSDGKDVIIKDDEVEIASS